MALEITIVKTSGVGAIEVPEDVATDLKDAWEALRDLPNNRLAVVDFDTPEAARLFVRQGKTWAAAQQVEGPQGEFAPLEFSRRGNVSEEPKRVQFRIYRPDTEKEKAAKKAEREAKDKG